MSEAKRIEKAKQAIADAQDLLEAALADLAGATDGETVPTPPNPKKILLLSRISKKPGKVVDKNEFHKLGADLGYKDPRGLGGLFVGKKPSLVTVAEGKISLAPAGEERLSRYQDWLAKNE
jgi:hypothetical protein